MVLNPEQRFLIRNEIRIAANI